MSFQYIPQQILRILGYLDSKWFKKEVLTSLYHRFWNPINYALVGAIGVGINFLVTILLMNSFVWWIVNFMAIGIAFLWNWSNSVGPFGWLWGFKKRKPKT